MTVKSVAKNLLPSITLHWPRCLRRARQTAPIQFTRNYGSWEDAAKDSTGYAAPEILAKTRAALSSRLAILGSLKRHCHAARVSTEVDSRSIAIARHRWPLALKHCEVWGRYDVELLCFRSDAQAFTCLRFPEQAVLPNL